jgi:peptidoglycan hydrolase-like protein with peptidoglycan-binding domain
VHTARRPLRFGLAVTGIALLVAAGCGKDDSSGGSSSSTTAPSSTTTAVNGAEVVKFDKSVQQQLADVGCYSGAIDGVFGPQTDAAVVAFQTASGLEVDGELGPETEAALKQAVAKSEKVCTGSSTTTTTAPTTTTVPSTSPCTATAIAAALPSGAQVNDYACSEGYAGVSYTVSGTAGTALLQSESGAWKDLGTSMCGGASAGYPPAVLSIVCTA